MNRSRLLVVDDVALQAEVMRAMLEPAGFDVVCALNGPTALQLAQDWRPDLILLDVVMPGMDGYTVCRSLKALEGTRHIPVIFVTVVDDDACETRCFSAGAADYMTKPIRPPVLLARIRAHLALASQNQSLRGMVQDVIEFAPDALLVSNPEGHIVRLNSRAEELTQYARHELIGQPIEYLLPQRLRASHVAMHQVFAAAPSTRRMRPNRTVLMLRKDGRECPVEVSLSKIETAEGPLFVSALHDASAHQETDAALRIAATAFESQEGMVVTDADSVILRVNRAFTEITGYSEQELVGKKPNILQSGHQSAEFYREMWATLARTGCWQGEIWDQRKNGEVYPKWLAVSAVKGDDGVVTHYVGTHYDITERKMAEERIHSLAFFDPLTGLPNRTLLLDRLKQALTASGRSGDYGALLFIDLDHFKNLNDTLGHDVGDLLLQQVGHRLGTCVRAGDTVARLGGDEFVVVLAGLSKHETEAASATESIAMKILDCLNGAYSLAGALHHGTASMGATLFQGTQVAIDVLMKHADLTMYKAKAGGRNTVRFFDPAMEAAVKARADVEAELRLAMAQRAFVLHYQPQVTGNGRITGVEALVRWQHPTRGLVPPGDFIGLAEETGLILPLGTWVLESACAQLALWSMDAAMSHLTMAVNVSAQQFRQVDFVQIVIRVLNMTGARPEQLKLELTESLLVHNVDAVVETMAALKARGVGFSLDDFGTGYSSLSYLKRLPLDQLKIDRSFVHDLLTDPNDAAIAGTIVALARNLGLSVIAEGVETTEQRDVLCARGCEAYQGYLYSRPVAVAQFEELLLASIGATAND